MRTIIKVKLLKLSARFPFSESNRIDFVPKYVINLGFISKYDAVQSELMIQVKQTDSKAIHRFDFNLIRRKKRQVRHVVQVTMNFVQHTKMHLCLIQVDSILFSKP